MAAVRVSVLLPVRNAVRTVDAAMRSIVNQTEGAWELIGVDDGSTDGSGEKLKEWARRDSRVRIIQGEGQGVVRALNRGHAECSAPLVARMDADDESHPERLALQLAALEADPTLTGVGAGVEIFREDRPVSPNMLSYARWMGGLRTPEDVRRERFIESPLCQPAVMMRKAALEDAGGYREGDFPEDYELWLRLLSKGARFKNLPEVLLRWRDQESRLTRDDPRFRRRAHLALKADYLSLELGEGPVILCGTGPTGLRLMRHLREHGTPVSLFVDVHPRKIGQRIDGIPVIAPSGVPPAGKGHLLAAVGTYGGREEVRGLARAKGWREGVDFTCCA
jgi:glycosyltransferase involved in cell wall biosynthesis